MKHVRLPLISRDFLMSHVDTEVIVRENTECKELLLEAMRYHLLPEQRSSMASERTTTRRPDGMKPYLFAIGMSQIYVWGGKNKSLYTAMHVFLNKYLSS
jgi:kelch-like protein 17 (actinfilin)